MYRVRVLVDDIHKSELLFDCKSYSEAKDLFLFYVRCALELGVSVWCCNILKGKKSIKMFQNHTL